MVDLPSPPDVELGDQVFDLCFHPTADLLACGLVNGQIHTYEYGLEQNRLVAQLAYHRGACRALRFSTEGTTLFSASSDRSIHVVHLETQQVVYRKAHAHAEAVNCLCLLNEATLASGDDRGCIKLWDLRTRSAVRSYTEQQTDFVADLAFDAGRHTLLAPCGDGTLGVYDIRQHRPIRISDSQDDELLSVAIVKQGTKVVCGSQGGVLNVFSWGRWGDVSDRFPGHPNSVDTMCAVGDDMLCTGSSDGLIRIVTVQPNKFIGVIGEHEDFPVEKICLSRDQTYMGSCSHDNSVKFWNVSYLFEDRDGDNDDDDDGTDAKLEGEEEEEEESSVDGEDAEDAAMEIDGGDDSSSDDSDSSDSSDGEEGEEEDSQRISAPKRSGRKRVIRDNDESDDDGDSSRASTSADADRKSLRQRQQQQQTQPVSHGPSHGRRAKPAGRVRVPRSRNFFADL